MSWPADDIGRSAWHSPHRTHEPAEAATEVGADDVTHVGSYLDGAWRALWTACAVVGVVALVAVFA